MGVLAVLLAACYSNDAPRSNIKLSKDFWLNWWGDSTFQNITISFSQDGKLGYEIVKSTVFAVGYNENFIIAKQHPDKREEIQNRLWNRDTLEGSYFLSDPSDTVWLLPSDTAYQKNGKWYHKSNNWNPPDSIAPDKKVTYFYILDIRKYKRYDAKSYPIYKFESESDFTNKRNELGVPKDLSFTIINPKL